MTMQAKCTLCGDILSAFDGTRMLYHAVGGHNCLHRQLHQERCKAEAKDAEIAEYDALFALQRTRMGEAGKAWQAATGKPDTQPDLGELLDWLLSQGKAKDDEIARLREEKCEKCKGTLRDLLDLFDARAALEGKDS